MAKKIDIVVVSYHLDRVLGGIFIDKGKAYTIRERMGKEKNVREWYTETYPTDELGGRIREGLTWADLFERMRNREEVYDIIDVGDSIVRERVFGHLAELLCVPYDVVYNLWLHEGEL